MSGEGGGTAARPPPPEVLDQNPALQVPRVARVLVVVMLVLTVTPAEYVALNPGYVMTLRVWQFLTAPLAENGVISFILAAAVAAYFANRLEPHWGEKEYLRYVGVVAIGQTVPMFAVLVFLYVFTGKAMYLYEAHLEGFAGHIGAFLITLAQQVPDQEFPICSLQVRGAMLPGIYLVYHTLMEMLFGSPLTVLMTMLGMFSGWVYLRFFQPRGESSASKGDASASFAFAELFPEAVRPHIASVSERSFAVAKACGCCNNRGDAYANVASSGDAASGSVLGSSASDAERRRELAERALERRLAQQMDV